MGEFMTTMVVEVANRVTPFDGFILTVVLLTKKPFLILPQLPEELFAKHRIQSPVQPRTSAELRVTTVLTLYCLPALLSTKDQSLLVLTLVESNFSFIPVEFIPVIVALLEGLTT